MHSDSRRRALESCASNKAGRAGPTMRAGGSDARIRRRRARSLCCPPLAAAQPSFTVGPVTAQPGTIAAGTLEVRPSTGDQGTTIPFTIIHGAKPGTGARARGRHARDGVHADPRAAADARRRSTATLAGTVIMVHVANMPSYLGRTIYYSPADNKNLNRVFPGNPEGTLSERIAEVDHARGHRTRHARGRSPLRRRQRIAAARICTGSRPAVPPSPKRAGRWRSPSAWTTSSSIASGRPIRRRRSTCRTRRSRAASRR